MPNPEQLTTARVAEILGVDRKTVTRWVEAGRITPTLKLDGLRGAYIFAAEEVERVRREVAA